MNEVPSSESDVYGTFALGNSECTNSYTNLSTSTNEHEHKEGEDKDYKEHEEHEEHEELLDDPILRYSETPEEAINRISSYPFRPNEPIPGDVNSDYYWIPFLPQEELAEIEDTNFLILFCQRFNKYLKENGLPLFLLNGPAENHPNGRGLYSNLFLSCDHYYTMLYMNYHFPRLTDVFSTYFYNNHDKIQDIVYYFFQSIIDIKDYFHPACAQRNLQLSPEIIFSVESDIRLLEREFKQENEKYNKSKTINQINNHE